MVINNLNNSIGNKMKLSMQIDPLSVYSHISNEDLVYMLGYLPGWAENKEYFDLPFVEAMDAQYGFGLHKIDKATIKENGLFKYPEDPDQEPLVKITRGDEYMYIYPYSIVAFVNANGSTFATRMD